MPYDLISARDSEDDYLAYFQNKPIDNSVLLSELGNSKIVLKMFHVWVTEGDHHQLVYTSGDTILGECLQKFPEERWAYFQGNLCNGFTTMAQFCTTPKKQLELKRNRIRFQMEGYDMVLLAVRPSYGVLDKVLMYCEHNITCSSGFTDTRRSSTYLWLEMRVC